MEYEVRYYFNTSKKDDLIQRIKNINGLVMKKRCYEKTSQFDHPNDDNSFYSKEIDGRFRVRVTKNDEFAKCKISWKRRIASTRSTKVNKEEEVELNIDYNEYDNLLFIINNVLKMKDVESYERYRTIFTNDDVEIALDEYPFGIALEIENKSQDKDPEKVVEEWVKKIGLDINESYRLSWDDKYKELCQKQGVKRYNHVSFDLPMPQILDESGS